jgi:hypothetical protein
LEASFKAQTTALDDYRIALDELAESIKKFPKISSNRPAVGLIPMVPAVQTPGAQSGGGGGQRNLPDKVEITVNSSIVNPLQVAQEIQDYLDQLNRAYGTYSV